MRNNKKRYRTLSASWLKIQSLYIYRAYLKLKYNNFTDTFLHLYVSEEMLVDVTGGVEAKLATLNTLFLKLKCSILTFLGIFT